MSEIRVKSVDMFSGPMGSHGFRSGKWTATTEDGRRFKFYGSLPHADGLNEERMIGAAEQALDNNNVEWIADSPPTIRYHDNDMPVELHRQIKTAAASSGKSLKAWVREALEEKLSMQ